MADDSCHLDPNRFHALYDSGLNVIPLLPKEKVAEGRWREYQGRRARPDEVEAWSLDPRGLNVGVIGGRTSQDRVFLDIDSEEARRELEERFGPLPITPTAKTPAGWHLCLHDTTGRLRNFVGKVKNVDLRANGGYVVGVGSIHPSGGVYRWMPGMSPNDIPVAPVPQWLHDLATGKRPPDSAGASVPAPPKPPVTTGGATRSAIYAERALDYEVDRLRQTRAGGRNATLNSSAFSLGQLVGAEALERDSVEIALLQACRQNSLVEDDGERSVQETLRSGLEAGIAEPRDLSAVALAPPQSVGARAVADSRSTAPGKSMPRSPTVRTLEDFMAQPYEPRDYLLAPWLRVKDLVMVYAPRGIGKTWVSNGMALAVTSGKPFLKWQVPKPRKVLLVDGEMPRESLQERMAALIKGGDYDPEGRLRIYAADVQDEAYPDISTEEGRATIDGQIEDAELLILDNLSSLCGAIVENDAEAWAPVQSWFLSLRRRGVAVAFFHHAGKSAEQRGTSKREDVLDSVISLRRPKGYESSEGARFELHFTKARGLTGDSVEPFQTQLVVGPNGGAKWQTQDMGDLLTAKILELHDAQLTQREIAAEVELDVSNVNRRLKKALEQRQLSSKRPK